MQKTKPNPKTCYALLEDSKDRIRAPVFKLHKQKHSQKQINAKLYGWYSETILGKCKPLHDHKGEGQDTDLGGFPCLTVASKLSRIWIWTIWGPQVEPPNSEDLLSMQFRVGFVSISRIHTVPYRLAQIVRIGQGAGAEGSLELFSLSYC